MDGCKGSVMQERSDVDEGWTEVPRGACPRCLQRLERSQINFLGWFKCPCCETRLVCSTAHRKFPKLFGICALAAVIISSVEVRDIMAIADVVVALAFVGLFLIYKVIPLPKLTVCLHDPDEEVQTLGLTK